jgi:hypothetical protein
MAREKRNRIDAYRNIKTGEIGGRHYIGQTKGGHSLYAPDSEWEPVARMEDGAYQPTSYLKCDRDGNWYVRGW